MSTYLINAPHDQKIRTAENIDTTDILAYSNPAWYEPKSLGRDFGAIVAGDQLILCRESQLKFVARVDEVIMATDRSGSKHNGLPVKLLKGKIAARYDRLSVAVIAHEMDTMEIDIPHIISPKLNGFKQGAFAVKLDEQQAAVCLARAENR